MSSSSVKSCGSVSVEGEIECPLRITIVGVEGESKFKSLNLKETQQVVLKMLGEKV